MMDISKKWCLVTGAARGIGRATAKALAARGGHLILCDNKRDEVDALAGELKGQGHEVLSYGADVSCLEEMKAFVSWVENQVAVDVLVNNAGILRAGKFLELDYSDIEEVFRINLWGVVYATKLIAPGMVERGRGAIVQVASASGRLGVSGLGAYGASKFAVVGLSQTLATELSGTGVSVSAVCPGLVNTDLVESGGFSEAEAQKHAAMLRERGMAPEKVALKIIEAIETGKTLLDVGWDARLLSLAARLSPTRASGWLANVARRLEKD